MEKLLDLERKKQLISHKIKQEKKKQHQIYYKDHKKYFILLDSLAFLCILLNFGAIVLTNIVLMGNVYDSGEEPQFREVNPVQRQINPHLNPHFDVEQNLSYEEEKEQEKADHNILFSLIKQSLMWAAMFFLYIINRRGIHTDAQLKYLTFIVFFYFFSLGYDFWHDFGLYIGIRLFG